jgi:hypothetical protein
MPRSESSSSVPAVTSGGATFDRAVVAGQRGDRDALRYLYARSVDDVCARLVPADSQSYAWVAAAVREAFAGLRGYDAQADGELVPWLVVRARGVLTGVADYPPPPRGLAKLALWRRTRFVSASSAQR